MAQLPYSIDLRPIGACNLRCPFCFGPRHERATMARSVVLPLLRLFAEWGTRVVVISGGEPTLLPDLPEYIRAIRTYGMRPVLSTNGILLPALLGDLLPNLDWIALPVDAADESVNQALRLGSAADYLANTICLIRRIRSEYPKVGVKLGTVVTRLNRSAVASIPSLLPEGARPHVWKIYQCSYSNYGKDNSTLLEISGEDFEEVVRLARQESQAIDLPMVVYRNSQRNRKYLFVDPNGDAVVIEDGDELVIGNLVTNPESVISIWREYIDEEKLTLNVKETYPRLHDSE